MKEDIKGLIVVLIVIVAITSFVSFMFYNWYIGDVNTEHRIFKAKIVYVNVSGYNIEYLWVTFDNGDSYRIYNVGNHHIDDFTVNSKWIVSMSHPYYTLSGYADYWLINSMVKVPD
jgi:hypothetical protein